MATEREEGRLRQLLRDDAWALPAWPDAEARVRKAARRQRMTTATTSAVACALVAAAVILPLRLAGGPVPRTAAGPGSRPAASRPAASRPAASRPTASEQAAAPQRSDTPPVNAPGYPVSIYPPPRVLKPMLGAPFYCPGGTDMRPFSPAGNVRALTVLKQLGHDLDQDLRLTDRAFWPTLLQEWQTGGDRLFSGGPGSVLYAGPLVNYHLLKGPPDLDGLIAASCGSWLAVSTWMIVAGPAGNPDLESELLFINRSGHVLLYYAQ